MQSKYFFGEEVDLECRIELMAILQSTDCLNSKMSSEILLKSHFNFILSFLVQI
jgi:hypothetical protein